MSFGAHTETIGILADLWIADYLGSVSAALSFCWAVSYKSPLLEHENPVQCSERRVLLFVV
jgi:hypothetical protein